MKSLVGITVLTALLSSCFNAPVTSNGKVSVINGEPRAAFAKAIAETKALSSFDPASKVETSIQPPSGALANSKITMPPGALNISADLVIEESVPMSETSVVSSLGMSAEITIVPIGAGIIIRPSQSVNLTKPLTIALSLGESSGLRAWLRSSFLMRSSVHYAVFYKSMIAGELRAGVIPTSSLRLTDNNQVQFEGYFGAYWLVEVSAPVEEKIEVPTTEPAVNINRISVIDNTGIVAEETIAAKADIPLVQWATVSMSFNPELRTVSLSSSINADRTVNQCQVDLRSSIAASSGTNANTDSRLSHTEKITNKEAHPLVGRFRCQDDQGRLTLSAWSAELQIPKEPDPAAAGSITIDSGAAFTSSSQVTLAIAATAAKDMYITAVKDCTSGGTWEAYKSSKSWDLTESNGTASVYVKFRNPLAYESLCISDSIQHDSIPPIAPSSLVFGGSSTAAATLSLAFAPGTDQNFSTHEARLCTAADCTTGCGSTVQSASSPVSLTGTIGLTYYGCARSLDQAGNSSNWIASIGTTSAYVASGNSVAVDTTAPTAPSAIAWTDTFSKDTTAALSWTHGSDNNFSTHHLKACTNSGCSTGCTSPISDAASPASLSGLITGNSYYACVQSVDLAANTSAWIPSAGTITIDTISPGLPLAVTLSNTFQISFTAGTETNPSSFNLKACTDAGCSAACVGDTSIAASPGQIALEALTVNTAYYGCVQATDLAANTSAFVASGATSTRYPYLVGYKANGASDGYINYAEKTSTAAAWTLNAGAYTSVAYTQPLNDTGAALVCDASKTYGQAAIPQIDAITSDGIWAICVRLMDAASNIRYGKSEQIIRDTAPPVLASLPLANSASDGYLNLVESQGVASDLAGSLNATGYVSADYKLVPSATSCTSVNTYGAMPQSSSSDLASEGSYKVCVRLADEAGNFTFGYSNSFTVDRTRPAFIGVKDILRFEDSTKVMLFWERASDNISPVADITFEICMSSTIGSCAANFVSAYSIDVNIWNHEIYGLTPGVIYEFMVRAKDEAGNIDQNVQTRKNISLTGVAALALGQGHSCALLSDSTVRCWGDNAYGKLGDGTSITRFTPTLIPGLSGVAAVAVGQGHSCARLADSTVKCWGANNYGQLGDGTSITRFTPTLIPGLSGVSALVLGEGHSCALLSDSTVSCWGFNGYGQLGDGTAINRITPTVVSGLSGVYSLALGQVHSCALLLDSTVKCWGNNSYGKLGDGTTLQRSTATVVAGLTGVSSLSLGGAHSCALLSNSSVKCWGGNFAGQLGDGTTLQRLTPTLISGLSGVSALALGEVHSCALLSDATVSCWGNNSYGQLGNGAPSQRLTPALISGLNGVASLALGERHSCVLLSDSTVKCWGNNSYGQLGNGAPPNRFTPTLIPGLSQVSFLALGEGHSCALLSDSTVKCWGLNAYGQLGDGTTINRITPTLISGLSGVSSLALGEGHSCAVLSDSTVKCWGANVYGKLGDGTTTNRFTPTLISGLSGVSSLALGWGHSCALLSNSTVKCWGSNLAGQLGDGTTLQKLTATVVPGLSGVSSLALGEGHSCALLIDSTVSCWGSNGYGQLGDGTTLQKLTATVVPGLSGVSSLALGQGHSCALLSDSTVKCWGANSHGQLGDGTTVNRFTPTLISGLSGVSSLALGWTHSCAPLLDSTVKCWGFNGYGQLGEGTNTPRFTPTLISGLSGVSSLALGAITSCALLLDSTMRCWGSNLYGQFGYQ